MQPISDNTKIYADNIKSLCRRRQMQKDPNGQSNASDVSDCVLLQKKNSKRRLHRLVSAYISVWADKYDPLCYIKGKHHCR